VINGFFRRGAQKEKSRPGIPRAGSLKEAEMPQHHDLLPRILVKIGIRVKITVVRR